MEFFNSVEDCSPVHILDLIKEWPKNIPPKGGLELIKNHDWKYVHGKWVLLDKHSSREFYEGHWLNHHENKKKYAQPAPHIFDLIDVWPQPVKHGSLQKLPDGWDWVFQFDKWVLTNGTVNLTESDWRNSLVQLLRDNQPVETKEVTAASMLQSALGHMEDRAKTYDTPGGERSMGKTVAAFNIITGLQLSEEQGWLFMEILKQVRSQQGNYRSDSYEDLVAYAALRGECAARERGDK